MRNVLSANISQIPTEDHTVSEGEHLAQVLRDMYNIPDDLIFDEYLDLVKKLNPGLEDVNLVTPDQKIVLPSVAAYQLSPRVEEPPEETIQEELVKEDVASEKVVEQEVVEQGVVKKEVAKEEPVEKKDLSRESVAAEELPPTKAGDLPVR